MNTAELIRELGIPTAGPGDNHYSESRGWVQTDCPLCSPNSRRFRLGIKGRGAFCFTCGKVNLATALSIITGKHWTHFRDLFRSFDPMPAIERPKGTLRIPPGVGPLLPSHERYLRQRGFDPRQITKLWGVQGIGLASRLPWRLFIPMFHDGETVSWTTRAIGSLDKIKYVGAKPEEETLPAKTLLYGEQFARHAVIVVEGPIDCWAGGPGTVATLGLSYTPAQVSRIAYYPMRAVCFDAEPEAQRRASDLCSALSALPGRTVRVELESGKDLAEADPKEIKKIREKFLGE